jgi:hypothetical protein
MESISNHDILKKIEIVEIVENGKIFKIEYNARFNILKINIGIQEDLMNDVSMFNENQSTF